MIVFVFGLPGSGKSYFASRLAKMINAIYANSDRIRKELFSQRTYSDPEKKAVYDTMIAQMEMARSKGQHLVLDATFHKNQTRERFLKKTSGMSDIFFIEVQANQTLIRKRLQKSRPYSEADYKVYASMLQHWEPLSFPHLVLQSTDDNIDEMLLKATAYLGWKNDERTNP